MKVLALIVAMAAAPAAAATLPDTEVAFYDGKWEIIFHYLNENPAIFTKLDETTIVEESDAPYFSVESSLSLYFAPGFSPSILRNAQLEDLEAAGALTSVYYTIPGGSFRTLNAVSFDNNGNIADWAIYSNEPDLFYTQSSNLPGRECADIFSIDDDDNPGRGRLEYCIAEPGQWSTLPPGIATVPLPATGLLLLAGLGLLTSTRRSARQG